MTWKIYAVMSPLSDSIIQKQKNNVSYFMNRNISSSMGSKVGKKLLSKHISERMFHNNTPLRVFRHNKQQNSF